ncbi:MAG: hypothetical protein ACKOB8_12465 [Mycobacterium sp.]
MGPEINAAVNKLQIGTAAVPLPAAAANTPVAAQADKFALAPSLSNAGPVLTWGYDQLDAALIAQQNDGPRAAAVGATPAELLQYLVQGIADGIAGIVRGTVVIVGTTAYVAIAFTGGLITTVGNFLPGPVGDALVNFGTAVDNVANAVAEALRVGPYATFA